MKKIFLLTALILSFSAARAQFYFTPTNTVPVEVSGQQLNSAWSGGLNSSQFSKIDLNGDGVEDLFVFDRASNKPSTFLATNTATGYQWVYHPEYEMLFPKMEGWVFLRDYNGDGLKDIFAETTLEFGGKGIKVYKNVASAGSMPVFQIATESIMSTSFSGNPLVLSVTAGDLPDVVDVDSDGDLDVLVFEFAGGFVEFHKNYSIENTGNKESLIFQKGSGCWGKFYEGFRCNTYEYNVSCRPADQPEINSNPQKVNHAGSTLTAFDVTGDGTFDLLLGDIGCNNLSLMINTGQNTDPLITQSDTTFPNNTKMVDLHIFPAAFFEDINFDNKKDLLVGVNATINDELINFSKSNWLYTNTGTATKPVFNFTKEDFLQDQMMEQGESTNPVFADFDGDGDMDLFSGNYGQKNNGGFFASIAQYENTGTATSPAFRLLTNDYLGLSALKLKRLKPLFADINGDGKQDILFVNAYSGNSTDIKYIFNTAGQGQTYQFNINSIQTLSLTVGTEDSPQFYDVDGDKDLDVVLAKFAGRLQYFRNDGSNTAPQYTLAINDFGGVTDSQLRTNPKITIADLDNNGIPELIKGDRSGELTVYKDFTRDINAAFQPITNTLYNSLLQRLEANILSKFHLSPAAADLDGDGFPEVIAGTKGGGFTYLKNLKTSPVSATMSTTLESPIELFPNPASKSVTLKSAKTGKISITDISGRIVIKDRIIEAEVSTEIDISHLAPGLYLIKHSTSNNFSTVKKLVVTH